LRTEWEKADAERIEANKERMCATESKAAWELKRLVEEKRTAL
jgi:hypothetical protein